MTPVRSFSLLLILTSIGFAGMALAGEVRVRTLTEADEASGVLCARCVVGDYLLSNENIELVVGASHRRDESFYRFPTADALGSLVFLRAAGSDIRGDIMVGTPYVRINNTTRHINYENLEVQQSAGRVTVVASGTYRDDSGERARFELRLPVADDSEQLDLSLAVTNVGTRPLENFIYALYFDPHQMYDFSPADSGAHAELPFRGYPRANHLVAWADPTPRKSDGYNQSGWDGGMILPDPLAVKLQPGDSETRHYTLLTGNDQRRVLENVFRLFGVQTHTAQLDLHSRSSGFVEVIVQETESSAVFFRGFLDAPGPLQVELPVGNYTAIANFFPGTARCTLTVTGQAPAACRLQDPPVGRLKVRILDPAGKDVPGKVSFNGQAATPTPYFRPHNPAYDDGYWESAKNSVFPLNTEAEVTLPEGSYLVSASRGPEYSLDQQTVQVRAGAQDSLVLQIERLIERHDLVSMDPHMHTLESDGAVSVREKIEALVASGVNVAISSDHNYPVDYQPALEQLGLQNYLTVYTGAEVTVPERLDYNTYPMLVQPEAYNHGAIDSLSTDLGALFQASRKRDPGVIVQVNHPRYWQFDYFSWHGLDPQSAAYAFEGLDLTFDVLEVVNGAIYENHSNLATRNDWFNLLRRGYFFPLVGSSDSHEIDQDEPGFSRTYVYRGDNRDTPLQAGWLMRQVRAGHSFASNGPILDLTVEGQLPGNTVSVADGSATVQIDVWTVPWIEAQAVQLYVNGEGRPVQARRVPDPLRTHLRAELELPLDSDVFLVAEVTGTRELFPMLQRRVGLDEEGGGLFPYALTNPVFVDVDGNGSYDPPLPHEIELRPR